MKKILPFLFIVVAASAQVQRQVLVEEFSSASAGLCASINPLFNQLLTTNATKVIPVKYELALPCCDPMFYQDSADSQNRSLFYNPQIPYGICDGTPIVNDCPSSFPGIPSCLSQTEIDSMYAIPSPFSLTVNQQISPTLDSIYVTVVVTAAQNISMISPVLRLSMREQFYHFYTPPGGTSERNFYCVNRKMLPDANGTMLNANWSNGQTQTFSFTVKIPDYIYNRNQLTFAAWIQDDATHDVMQAGESTLLADTYDAGFAPLSMFYDLCDTLLVSSAQLTLTNPGDSVLTSCVISYSFDDAPLQSYNWTGNLAHNGMTNVLVPVVPPTNGIDHYFRANVNFPDGHTDFCPNNNSAFQSFLTATAPPSALPYTEDFENNFPPPGISFDTDDSIINWVQTNTGGFGNSAHCAFMDFWNYVPTQHQKDVIYLPYIDLSLSNQFSWMTFSVAYQAYINPISHIPAHDSLWVQVSPDCGFSWTTVYAKGDTILASIPGSGSDFFPLANQWRKDSIDLSMYNGNPSLAIRFRTNNDYGNPLYLDDINIDMADAVHEITSQDKIDVYPVPANQQLTFQLSSNSVCECMLFDATGKRIKEVQLHPGANTLDVSSYASGFYSYLILGADENASRGKFVIQR